MAGKSLFQRLFENRKTFAERVEDTRMNGTGFAATVRQATQSNLSDVAVGGGVKKKRRRKAAGTIFSNNLGGA